MDLYDLEKTAILSGGFRLVSGVAKPVFKTVSKAFGGGKAAARTVESVVPQSQAGRILAMKPGVYTPNKAAVTATQGPVTRHSTTIGGSQIRATPIPKRVSPTQPVTPSSVAATPAAPRQAPLQITHNPGTTRQPIENTGVHSYTHKPSANSWRQANGGARAATKTVETPQSQSARILAMKPGVYAPNKAAVTATPASATRHSTTIGGSQIRATPIPKRVPPAQPATPSSAAATPAAPHQAPAQASDSVWQHQELPGEVAAKKSWMPSKAGMAAIGGSLVVGGVLGHAVASPKNEYQEPQ